jgi:FlaG/FlaF family flagellin (archaellin)
MKNKKVKGLSPVIATVLLITIVVVIALIVFFWIKGMTQEAITKFGDQNIQLVCDQVSFEASYTGNTLYITNPGNVPIFGMNVKVVGEGSHETLDLREESTSWPEIGLNQGGVFEDDSLTFSGSEMVLIPVLLGESESGRKTYVCDEGQYGYQLMI